MPLNIGDLFVGLSVTSINSVIGKSTPVKINFSNISTTSPGYNLSCEITLPDGISFVSASISGEQISYSGNNQIIDFTNIKDLYPNESYTIDMLVMVDELYRGSGLPVPFNTAISGINVDGVLDSMPRGDVDPGNIKVTSTATATATGIRYSFKIVFPPFYLKGAGATLADTPTNPFDISFEIENNTRESSSLDSIDIDLANGIRYIDTNYSAIGADATQFQTPTIIGLGVGHNNYTISFSNIILSAGSDNIISFEGAIWNQYTDNGIANSGSFISNGATLSSQASVATAGQYEYEYAAMGALELIIEKLVLSKDTDVLQANEFTLKYQIGEYSGLSDIVINDLLSDGLAYDVGSTSLPYTSLVDLGSGITKISWDIGTLASNASGVITFTATTLQQYYNGIYVSSGDTLTNTMEAVWTDPGTTNINTLTSQVKLSIATPTITKTISGYYDSSLNLKTVQNATKGEYVGFLISYDATSISAQQGNVQVFDYAPLSTIITSIPAGIIYTGDMPSGIVPEIVQGNGIMWPVGDLSGNSEFTIEFKLQVTDFNSIFQDNLAKINFVSTGDIGYSISDSVPVAIATSNPSIESTVTQTTTPINSAVLDSVYDYVVTIDNVDLTSTGNPTSTIYNSTVTIDIPSEFSFYNGGTPDVTPVPIVLGGIVGTGTIISPTQYSLPITMLEPNGTITITFQGKATSALVAKKSYVVTSTMTQGTTEAAPPYENYPGGDLQAQSTVTASNIGLAKVLIPSTVPLYGGYSTTVTLTIPQGIIAYNVILKDTTISNNNSLVTNVMLNGSEPVGGYTISSNILTVSVAEVIDATSSPVVYQLTFNDVATNFTGSSTNVQIRTLTTTSRWGGTSSETNTFNRAITRNITIVAPTLNIDLLQSNDSTGYGYTDSILIANEYDNCSYKFEISNTGYSPAYDLVITDTLPANIDFVSYGNIVGTYNSLTRALTFNLSQLNNGATTSIYFNVSVAGSIPSSYVIANNVGSVQYATISGDTQYFNDTSNTVKLVKEPLTVQKLQKNLTTSSVFVTTTEEIITGQQMSYKLIISNVGEDELTNVDISDTFPSELTFVSFEPFSYGILNVISNNVTGFINSIQPGENLEIIYTVAMHSNVLKSYSSTASAEYNILNQSIVMTNSSNSLLTLLYGVGRGYKVY